MASPSGSDLSGLDQAVSGNLDRTSVAHTVVQYREILIACYELLGRRSPNGITVEDFCRALLADTEGPPNKSEKEVAFMTALLKTFKIQSRDGSSFLLLSSRQQRARPDGSTRMRIGRERQLAASNALARRLGSKCLTNHSDIEVRVTECFLTEEKYIKICFHRKEDEAKLRDIMTELAIADLGKGIKSFKGLICAAPASEGMNDEEGYARAIVVKAAKKQDRLVKVRFLDFGFVNYVEKTSLRKLPAVFLKTPALAYTAVVVNTRIKDTSERQNQAARMINSEETLIKVLKYNKERKFHEVFVYKPSQRPDLGFQLG